VDPWLHTEDLGVPFPYGDWFAAGYCNDGSGGPGHATPTGSYPLCTSSAHTYDMSGNLGEWTDSLDPDPEFPNCSYVGGNGYLCDLCEHGVQCHTCVPGNVVDQRNQVMSLDCFPTDRYFESLARATALAYLGARCCLDGP
jgi:formylglycine-generating enzyme required for sulfatase activity